jgi:hypothetical protein
VNAFCAKLSALGTPELDQRQRGFWVLEDALESTPWEKRDNSDIEQRRNPDDPDNIGYLTWRAQALHLRSVSVLDAKIPAAAAWIQYDCKGLYEMQGEKEFEVERARDGSLWKGPLGWSRERYSFWKERFLAVSTMEELERGTRDVAMQAAESMLRIEKS